MLGAVSAVIFALIFRADGELIAFLVILMVLNLKMHSGNIARLMSGNENKIGKKE
jgi:glycerol-3-phosphate acyltransferase PlsY